MADPIQSTSSIPIPFYQQVTNQNNLAVVNSPASVVKAENQVVDKDKKTDKDDFESYLNQQSITTLKANQKSKEFDPVQEIFQNGVYQSTGQGNPI